MKRKQEISFQNHHMVGKGKWRISPTWKLDKKKKRKRKKRKDTTSSLMNSNVSIRLLIDIRKSRFCCLVLLIDIRNSHFCCLVFLLGLVLDSAIAIPADLTLTVGSSQVSRLSLWTTNAMALSTTAYSPLVLLRWAVYITTALSPG